MLVEILPEGATARSCQSSILPFSKVPGGATARSCQSSIFDRTAPTVRRLPSSRFNVQITYFLASEESLSRGCQVRCWQHRPNQCIRSEQEEQPAQGTNQQPLPPSPRATPSEVRSQHSLTASERKAQRLMEFLNY